MNLTNMLLVTSDYLDDPGNSRHSVDAKTRHINAAQQDIKRYIEDGNENFFVDSTTTTVVAGDADYEFELPLAFGKLIAVENTSEGVPVPAIPTTFQDRHDSIRIDKRFLANGVTYTGGYYLKHDFDSSLWKICFTSPDSGYTATITYNSDLPDLAGGGTVSKIPSTFHDLICLFAAMRGYAIEQQKFPEGLETLRQEQLIQLRNFVETFGRHGPRYVNVQE